jgi:hypothetical protein
MDKKNDAFIPSPRSLNREGLSSTSFVAGTMAFISSCLLVPTAGSFALSIWIPARKKF